MNHGESPAQSEHTTTGPDPQETTNPEVDLALVSRQVITDDYLISLPDPSADGLEGALGHANERRYADARTRLAAKFDLDRLLPGASSSSHGETINAMLVVTIDEAWDAIGAIALHDDLRPGRVSFGLSAADEGTDDVLPFASTYGLHRPNLGALAAKAASNAAVVIHGIEGEIPELWSLVADFETVGGRPVSAAAVVLQGRAAHIEKSKRVTDALLIPLNQSVTIAVDDLPITTVGARSGIVARAGHELTVSVGDPTSDEAVLVIRVELPIAQPWGDVLSASASARFHPLFRADLPTSLDRPIESYGGTLYDDPGHWRVEVTSALSSKAYDNAAALSRVALAPRGNPAVGLLTSLAFRQHPSGYVRCPANAGLMFTQLGDEQLLATAGTVVTLPAGVTTPLAPFLDGRPIDTHELLAALDGSEMYSEEAIQLLVELVHFELLEPAS